MAITWEKASPEVIAIAKMLIDKYHPSLQGADIGFLFRSEASQSQGKATVGKATKVPDRLKPYINLHFIIWLAYDRWELYTSKQREALIDHELCHCTLDEDGVARMRPHDIQEFQVILDRYGLWNQDLFRAKGALSNALQGRLPGIGDGKVVAISPERAQELAQDFKEATEDREIEMFVGESHETH